MGFNTNELRIGNLVDIINRSGEVHLPHNTVKMVGQIQFFKVNLYEPDKPFAIQGTHLEIDASDICPIPLNELWVVKYGFSQLVNMHPAPNHVAFELGVIHVKLYNDRQVAIWVDDLPLLPHRRWSVHQLQNLYHALYGTELEFTGALAKKF